MQATLDLAFGGAIAGGISKFASAGHKAKKWVLGLDTADPLQYQLREARTALANTTDAEITSALVTKIHGLENKIMREERRHFVGDLELTGGNKLDSVFKGSKGVDSKILALDTKKGFTNPKALQSKIGRAHV